MPEDQNQNSKPEIVLGRNRVEGDTIQVRGFTQPRITPLLK